jgi:hypothetical protein
MKFSHIMHITDQTKENTNGDLVCILIVSMFFFRNSILHRNLLTYSKGAVLPHLTNFHGPNDAVVDDIKKLQYREISGPNVIGNMRSFVKFN